MFEIVLKPLAIAALDELSRFHAKAILEAMERHLRNEPDRPSKAKIKRLRGKQQAAYRLRVGDYRVFYDLAPGRVTVIAILHKSQTFEFYNPEESP